MGAPSRLRREAGQVSGPHLRRMHAHSQWAGVAAVVNAPRLQGWAIWVPRDPVANARWGSGIPGAALVLEAKNAPAGGPPEDAVLLPEGQQMDGPLRRAIIDALPEGTTVGFNSDGDGRTWMHVIGPGGRSAPGLTREVLNTALASLNRPALDSQG